MILESQFDKVFGRQFLTLFKCFPSFGSKDRAEAKGDGGKILVSTLNIHDSITFCKLCR